MNTETYPTTDYLRLLARKAGVITRKNFTLGMGKEWKGDESPQTVTDTQINDLVIEEIGRDFPGVSLIGEEGSREVSGARYLAIFDPVDGTIPFSVGIPVSAFCITIVDLETLQAVSAVIYDPFQDRMWFADKGKGAMIERPSNNNSAFISFGSSTGTTVELVKVSEHSTIHRSHICMVWWKGGPYKQEMYGVSDRLMEAGAKTISPASIAYFGGLVASGALEATIFPGDQAWETMAMQLIVEEAGGKATDLFGKPIKYVPGKMRGHVISNGLFHDELVELIWQGYDKRWELDK